MISLLDRVENAVEKEKILVTSIFFFSNNVFKKASYTGVVKVVIVRYRVNRLK